MKIGYFTDTYFPQVNGVTFVVDEWKRAFEKQGDEPHVFYPGGKPYTPTRNEHPTASIRMPFYNGYRIALPFGVKKHCHDLEVIHTHGLFSMAWSAKRIAKKLNKPLVLSYHTPVELYMDYMTKRKSIANPLTKLYFRWERKLMKSCDLVTAPSTPIKTYLEEKGIKNVRAMSYGMDTSLFKKVDASAFKKKYGLKGTVIGYCGRIGYEKRIEDVINLAPKFNGTIIIAGGGPQDEYYKGLASRHKNVNFLGFIPREKLSTFYSALDVFVFPSVVETQGKVAMEAMACGVPVVGADVLALKETITPGKTGYLFEPGNQGQILDCVEKSIKNRKKLSKNCLEFARQHSTDTVVKKLRKIYKELSG